MVAGTALLRTQKAICFDSTVETSGFSNIGGKANTAGFVVILVKFLDILQSTGTKPSNLVHYITKENFHSKTIFQKHGKVCGVFFTLLIMCLMCKWGLPLR